MNHIDAIFYINLESRPDRRDHFLNEIQYLTTDVSKVHRIDAIYEKQGALGCTRSHIKALETFLANPSWKTCLILEDDFTWKNQDLAANEAALQAFFTEFPDFDCVNLGVSCYNLRYTDTSNSSIKHAISVQTTSGYAVSRAFAPILLENFQISREKLTGLENPELYSLDQNWKKLQPISHWYLFLPALGYQYANYSDINHKVEDYNC
jgi:GR25 family glycosyltransferase involved in LPS biosynthesis